MGSKQKHDKKRGLRKVRKAKRSSKKTKWSHLALFAAHYVRYWCKLSGLDLSIISGV